MGIKIFGSAPVCHIPTTGQIIEYHPRDDGANQFGIKHDFEVLSTGDQSGTVNIVLNGKTYVMSNNCVRDNNTYRDGKPIVWARYVPAANIGASADGELFWDQWTLAAESVTFNAAAKTITAAVGTPFNVSALCAGRKIDLTGTASNNIEITVASITTSVITTVENLVNEGPVDTSFATKGDLAWDFVDEANAKALGGYTDWALPNIAELRSIIDFGEFGPIINSTVFPSTPADIHWSSTTYAGSTSLAFEISFYSGIIASAAKAINSYHVRLVRS